MPLEFINKLVDLIVKYGKKEAGDDWESWTCGDFTYLDHGDHDHVIYKDITIYSS